MRCCWSSVTVPDEPSITHRCGSQRRHPPPRARWSRCASPTKTSADWSECRSRGTRLEAAMSDTGWLGRLRAGLTKSSSRLVDGISDAFRRRQLDEAALEELEEILIAADLGPVTAAKMTEALARSKFDKEVTDEEVRTALADEIAAVLEPVAQPIDLDPSLRPQIVLVVGVNGTGKTTTIGKLAKHLTADGQKVMLAAGDTFRAAAVEQLRIWGERAGCPVISRDTGADAAGLAYDAVEAARREGSDLLLIDTAGRLHNKDDLMAGIATIRTEEQTS